MRELKGGEREGGKVCGKHQMIKGEGTKVYIYLGFIEAFHVLIYIPNIKYNICIFARHYLTFFFNINLNGQ